MKLFLRYLREKRRIFLAFGLFLGLYLLSFWLFRLPIRIVLYPTALCLLVGAVFLAVDFAQVRERHIRLTALWGMAEAISEHLPPAESITSEDQQELIRELEAHVAQLRQEADARFRDRMDYYSVWVHQIKTPIAAMHLLVQNEDTALARDISAQLFRIEQYVEMVLAYLRLDGETGDYVFRECSIDAIVRDAVKKFAPEFIGRHLRLDFAPLSGTVVTDEKWLGFVVEQLLSNALKYTRQGSIRISMEGKTLCIADTGIGIAPEDLPRIFEKGYTGGNGRLDRKASGLGLYLCRRVCENLHVGLWAESAPGEGTAMYLDLKQADLRME